MDLRVYYQKIRKLEEEITEPFAVLVSRETPDGGKPGIRTDVPKKLAARMIAEEKAELASLEETARFRAETRKQWEAEAAAEAELRAWQRSAQRQGKR